ncbi:MAG: hypothetical protein CSA19_01270 [Deltaproteobacteria bacterium]|nr:MAG: hypothetical protein CSA19_01270 [Deltaproteobacteria bacterium]
MNIETTKALQKYQQEKRQSSREMVNRAIAQIQANGDDVNFKNVSVASGVSRKTLYKVDEFRNLIKEKRGDQNEDGYKETILKQEQKIKYLQEVVAAFEDDKTKLEHIKLKLKAIYEKIEGARDEVRKKQASL